MSHKNIIIYQASGQDPEPFGNFKKMCLEKGLPYHSLKGKKFPIKYKDVIIYKKPL
jgi:hypothetical protein